MISMCKVILRAYKTEFFLFFLALAVQLIIFVITIFFGSGGFLWSSDAESYFTLAKNLLQHRGFFIDVAWGPSAFRTPLYPLFVAGLYWLVPKLGFVIFVQNIVGAASVVLAYRLGRVLFTHRVAFAASLLYLFESQRLQVMNQLMSEALFLVFFLPALIFFFRYRSERRMLLIAASAIFLGLATLTKPIIQFLPLVMVFFLVAERPFLQTVRKNAVACGIFLLLVGAVLSPWIVRNKIHFDTWKLSPLGGTNLYFVNAAHFLQYQAKKNGVVKEFQEELTDKALHDLNLNLDRSDWVRQSIRLMEFEYEPYFTREAIRIISADPLAYLGVHARRTVAFFIDSSLSRSASAISFKMPNRPDWIFYPYLYWGGRFVWVGLWFTVAGAFILNRRFMKKRIWLHAFFLATMLYIAALAAMNWDAPRMRLPINPLIFMVFAESLFLLVGLLRGKRAKDLHDFVSRIKG
jgi:4-amino-4-deoxy-L-arabinose transferase-like glycosyltransferase